MKLVFGYSERVPEKCLLRYDEVGKYSAHNYGTDFSLPDFALFVECFGCEERFYFTAETEDLG